MLDTRDLNTFKWQCSWISLMIFMTRHALLPRDCVTSPKSVSSSIGGYVDCTYFTFIHDTLTLIGDIFIACTCTLKAPKQLWNARIFNMLPLQLYGKFPGECHVIIREKLQTVVVCSSKSSWTSASEEKQHANSIGQSRWERTVWKLYNKWVAQTAMDRIR